MEKKINGIYFNLCVCAQTMHLSSSKWIRSRILPSFLTWWSLRIRAARPTSSRCSKNTPQQEEEEKSAAPIRYEEDPSGLSTQKGLGVSENQKQDTADHHHAPSPPSHPQRAYTHARAHTKTSSSLLNFLVNYGLTLISTSLCLWHTPTHTHTFFKPEHGLILQCKDVCVVYSVH